MTSTPLCQKCPNNYRCTSLCEPAEKIASQDEIKQREFIPKKPLKSTNSMWPKSTKSNRRLILELYFIDRLEQQQIADIVYVSKQYVSKVVTEAKKALGF